MHVGVVDGSCLDVSNDSLRPSVNVWIVKDEGHMGSWTLIWVVEALYRCGLGG